MFVSLSHRRGTPFREAEDTSIPDFDRWFFLRHLKHPRCLRRMPSLWSTDGTMLNESEGWEPSQKIQPFFTLSSSTAAPDNKAPAGVDLDEWLFAGVSLLNCPRLLFSLVSTSRRNCFLRTIKIHIHSSWLLVITRLTSSGNFFITIGTRKSPCDSEYTPNASNLYIYIYISF